MWNLIAGSMLGSYSLRIWNSKMSMVMIVLAFALISITWILTIGRVNFASDQELQVIGYFYRRQQEYYEFAWWFSFFIVIVFSMMVRMLLRQEKIKSQFAESEERLQIIFDSVQAGILIVDAETHQVFDVNQRALTMIGGTRDQVVGQECHQFVCPAERGKCPITDLDQRIDTSERVLLTIAGKRIPVIKSAFPIILRGRKYLLESFIDIVERKRVEDELLFLSQHDALTGLYNRTYFEDALKRLDEEKNKNIIIISCDIDGLKLVNDTLGHDAGDCLLIASAQIIQSTVGVEVAARMGGDEFSLILSQGNENIAEKICEQIQMQVRNYNGENNGIPLSISLGYGVNGNEYTPMSELLKEADNNMYREKLHRSQSARSDIVQTVMKMLEMRDFITEGHAERVEDLLAVLGHYLGLSEKKIGDIRLLAKFHDIGKVGIPDHILFKPGLLNHEERKEMNRHSEIGYRIAQASTDLVPIADWILKHHEWWDGKGYPLGLAGENIPFECRILAIVDSYDAMTNDRPYRKAMTHTAAVEELKRCAGMQFDPQLVEKFIAAI